MVDQFINLKRDKRMNKPDYSDKKALVEYYSKKYTSNFSFAQFLSERLDYFSDRFVSEHIEFFDLLWEKFKERIKKGQNEK